MNRLIFWIQMVGFSITELADVLFVTHSYLARLIRQKSTLPTEMIKKMYDPLFEPFDIERVESKLPSIPDPKPEDRIEYWQMELIELEMKLDKMLRTKALRDKNYRKNALILYHFAQSSTILASRTDVTAKWWAFMHTVAADRFRKQTRLKNEVLELEIFCLQSRIARIKNFLEAA